MFLDGRYQPEMVEGFLEVRFVQRFHGMEAYDLRRDSLFLEYMRCLHYLWQHISGREQAYILAFGYGNGLADLKICDRTSMHHRLALFSHPNIDRVFLLHRGAQGCAN